MSTSAATILDKPRFSQLISSTINIESRSDTLKATYWLLLGSIGCAGFGGYIGLHSEFIVSFFASTIGFIVGLVLLNLVPAIALSGVKTTSMGFAVLALDGFLSGIVISPLLAVASYLAPGAIMIAVFAALVIFGSITAYVMLARKTFSAPRALTLGMFLSIAAVALLGTQVNLGGFEIVLSLAICVFGVITLVTNTSRVLLNPEGVGAVPGALMLFAGMFSVFVGILRIVLLIMSGGRRR